MMIMIMILIYILYSVLSTYNVQITLKNSHWTGVSGPYSQKNYFRNSNTYVFIFVLKFCTISALMLSVSSGEAHSKGMVCVCVCVCMYVCMYVYMYVCVCKYLCMYVRMYVCMYVYLHVWMLLYICMCVYICIYVRLYVCMTVYVISAVRHVNVNGISHIITYFAFFSNVSCWAVASKVIGQLSTGSNYTWVRLAKYSWNNEENNNVSKHQEIS